MDKAVLLDYGIKKRNKELNMSWQEMVDKYGKGHFANGEQYRLWVKNTLQRKQQPHEEATIEIKDDGTHKSDRLLRMSAEQSKSKEYLLQAHGYDSREWELVNARNNIWNTYSKQDGVQTLYSSKITVKPKMTLLDFERIAEIVKDTTPIEIETEESKTDTLLEISLFDMHFGISWLDDYKETQRDIYKNIKQGHKEVLFTIGSDMLHHNDHRNRTASGREIQHVDMTKAWEDAKNFYEPLIRASIERSKTKVCYVKGNHDETLSWCFVQYLKARFPQAEFDDGFQERKIHTFGDCFIGLTHGDKGRKDIHSIFATEHPMEWAQAACKEIHLGHYHVEDTKDRFGTVVRTLATKNKTDQWHKDNGYVGAHKRFMLFEYAKEGLQSIHYV